MKFISNYEIVKVGGRVKAAAVSYCVLSGEAGKLVKLNDDIDILVKTHNHINSLRKNPIFEMLEVFFPEKISRIKKQYLNGVGFYRSMLKTDQGLGGNFFGFEITDKTRKEIFGNYPTFVEGIQKVTITEEHIKGTINKNENLKKLEEKYIEQFNKGDLENAVKTSYLINSSLPQTNGKRKVGRGNFFHCISAKTKNPLYVDFKTTSELEILINLKMETLENKAHHIKQLYKGGFSLDDAINETNQTKIIKKNSSPMSFYFQADVFLNTKRQTHIEQLNFPDVIGFLTQINTPKNDEIFQYIKEIVEKQTQSIKTIINNKYKEKRIFVLTRDEVVKKKEDTLELLEIKNLKNILPNKNLIMIKSDEINDLKENSQVLVLNIDPKKEEYKTFLNRVCDDEILVSTNPFLKILEEESGTLKKHKLNKNQLEILNSIKPGKTGMYNKNTILESFKKVKKFYNETNLKSPLLKFHILGQRPILTINFSLRSFDILRNYLNRYKEANKIHVQEIPLGNEIIKDKTGGRLAAFRFLITQKI